MFDRELNGDFTPGVCKQGHKRMWTNTIVPLDSEPQVIIPIEDCHAFKEKEKCECYDVKFHPIPSSGGIMEVFDLVCKMCGRKISR
jgi:hypothetical protein